MVVDANASCSGQVEAFLEDKVCSQLPLDVAKECVADVHAALPRIWATLINQVLDPGTACAAIGACTENGGHFSFSQEPEGQAGVAVGLRAARGMHRDSLYSSLLGMCCSVKCHGVGCGERNVWRASVMVCALWWLGVVR